MHLLVHLLIGHMFVRRPCSSSHLLLYLKHQPCRNPVKLLRLRAFQMRLFDQVGLSLQSCLQRIFLHFLIELPSSLFRDSLPFQQ